MASLEEKITGIMKSGFLTFPLVYKKLEESSIRMGCSYWERWFGLLWLAERHASGLRWTDGPDGPEVYLVLIMITS